MLQSNEYVKIALHKETLRRLLAEQRLHAEDLHCDNRQSKQALADMLLTLLLTDKRG